MTSAAISVLMLHLPHVATPTESRAIAAFVLSRFSLHRVAEPMLESLQASITLPATVLEHAALPI